MGWIGVDFDGTLVTWGDGHNHDVMQIGEPITPMVERVRGWLLDGKDVRIFTARVGPALDDECRAVLCRLDGWDRGSRTPMHDFLNHQKNLIEGFCLKVFGRTLPITCVKDFHMHKLYDDNAVQMVKNTGETLEDRMNEIIAGIDEAVRELPA